MAGMNCRGKRNAQWMQWILTGLAVTLAFPVFTLGQQAPAEGLPPIHHVAQAPMPPQDDRGLPPVVRPAEAGADGGGNRSTTALADQPAQLQNALLGGVNSVEGLEAARRAAADAASADAVLGHEAVFRMTTDAGNLIGESTSVRGVSSQQRTPIITDTRVRGERVGQVLAAGSYWAPVRMDLDTMMNKIDSRLVDSLLIIKGPYSPRYGPGFSFVDIELLNTPRYFNGVEHHGTSSVDYLTNGEQISGRQTVYGGGANWGYRASYGHRTGNDYADGSGNLIPSSYKSRDVNIALGGDLDPYRRIEFNYLRLDQTDVEFPGLVFDTNFLVTDGYEVKFYDTNPMIGDQRKSEVWFNRTRFEGDTTRPGKARQIPTLSQILYSVDGFSGQGFTDGDGSSFGYRTETIFGQQGSDHFAVGTDLILLEQEINDREIFLPPFDNNFPITPSESLDFGFYAERVTYIHPFIKVNAGARIDTIRTTSQESVPGFISPYFASELEQTFTTWMGYINTQTQLTNHWKGTAGYGYGQRPPTITELYANASFIGSLQRGLTFLGGDPELRPETLQQIDLGLAADYGRFQLGANWYHAWIKDFITYDLLTPSAGTNGLSAGAGFVNTPLATLTGVEGFGLYRLTPCTSLFGMASYARGTDRTRNQTSYLSDPFFDRSLEPGVPVEALPGIPPLDSRVGIRFTDGSVNSPWGLEYSLRAVARQNRVATTLEEVTTPGFVTMDIRGYFRPSSRVLITGGVENLTDRYYQEHLDYRSGLGVFQPGIGFYSGVEITY